MREGKNMPSLDLNADIHSMQDGAAPQLKDGQWHIETLRYPEHQSEAQRRFEYLRLMPKLALCCLLSDWLYLGYRILLVSQAPSMESSAYIVLSLEICFAGKSLPTSFGLVFTSASCGWTFASTIAFCLGKSQAPASCQITR